MLTKPLLDTMAERGCQMPGCKHDHDRTLYMHSRCHPSAQCEVSYTLDAGVVIVGCAECGRVIAEVKVAEE